MFGVGFTLFASFARPRGETGLDSCPDELAFPKSMYSRSTATIISFVNAVADLHALEAAHHPSFNGDGEQSGPGAFIKSPRNQAPNCSPILDSEIK
jgi:hypothetical protein